MRLLRNQNYELYYLKYWINIIIIFGSTTILVDKGSDLHKKTGWHF